MINDDEKWLNYIVEHKSKNYSPLKMLRAVLPQLRDHLPLEGVASLSSLLPPFIRGIFFEGWDPEHRVRLERSKFEFIIGVADILETNSNDDALEAALVVLKAFHHHIPSDKIKKLTPLFPPCIRELWIEAYEAYI